MLNLHIVCFVSLLFAVMTAGTAVDEDVHMQVLDLRLVGLPSLNLQKEEFQKLEVLYEALQSANIDREGLMEALTEKIMATDSTDDCLAEVRYIGNLLFSNKSTDQPLKAIASQYVDAMTKIPYGVLQGKWLWEGDYQQCKKIDRITNPQTNKSFKGTYMTGAIYSNGKPVLFNVYPLCVGFCIPDTCSEADAFDVLQIGLNIIETYIKQSQLKLTVVQIESSEMPSLSSSAIATLTVIGIIIFLMALGTLLDYIFSNDENHKVAVVNNGSRESDAHGVSTERSGLLSGEVFGETIQQEGRCHSLQDKLIEFFKAFSLRTNAVKLFGTKTADGPLACLNGLRVLSMWWVILGHSFAFVTTGSDNPLAAIDFIKSFSFQPILNGTFSVDSFFFLSGLLVAYLAIKEILEKGKLNWVYFFVHRYWRLTPLLAFVILFYTNMFPYIIFGPNRFFVDTFKSMTDACQNSWWSNLLYINNFYPHYGSLSDTCIAWTWYLANDMQFYIFISPIVILTLTRKKTLGLITITFLILSCVLIRGAIVLYYEMYSLSGAPTKHVDEPMGKNGALYARPYARHSVYVIGMLIGYILAAKKNRIRMYRSVAILGWIVAIATGLSVVYGQYYYNHHSDEVPAPHMTLAGSVFYVSLCRTAWGFCLAWLVLACVAGKGGVVKDILSWKLWAPLGRLTYAAYLVHPITIYFFYYNQERPIHLSNLTMAYRFIGNLVVAYGCAFIVSMGVEAPMIQLERLFIKVLKSLRSSRTRSSYSAF